MDIRLARQILDAALPAWMDDAPAWEDVLPHESVRRFHAMLVHAIEQRGWEDPVDAVLELLETPRPRPEERLLTEALATWVDSTGGPLVPAPPEAPGALRAWAREHGVEDLLDRTVGEVDPYLAPGHVRGTLADVYRAAAAPGRARGSTSPDPYVARNVLLTLHDEAIRRVERSGVEQRLRDLETRSWSPAVEKLFARLTELARELTAAAPMRLAPTPMGFRDDPPRFVPSRSLGGSSSRPEEGVTLEDGLVPVVRSPYDVGPAACLALVDGARLALADPETARHVEAVLSTPAWQRMLDGLAGMLAEEEAAPPQREERIEWRVEPGRDGAFQLSLHLQKRRKNGGWTRGRRVSATQVVRARLADDSRSSRIARALFARIEQTSLVRPAESLVDVLEVLAGDALVHATSGARVQVRRTAPRLSFEERAGALVPRIRIGGLTMTPREVSARLGTEEVVVALDEDGESPIVWIAPFDRAQQRIVRALASRPAHVPDDPEARRALASRLPALGARLDLDLPEALRGRLVPADRRPLLRLDLRESELRMWLGVRPLPGTSMLRAGEGPPVVVAFPGAAHAGEGARTDTPETAPVHARRDFEAEIAAEAAEIARLGLASYRQPDGSFCVSDLDASLELVEAVQGRAEDLQLEWAREERPRVRALRPGELSLRISRGKDWWSIAGGADTELGHVALASLLRAAREGRRFVEVAPGAFARIEASLRQRLARADAHLRDERGQHVFGTPAAEAIDDLATDGAFDAAPAFFDLVERVRRARTEDPRLDAPIAAVLRPYQRSGFEWLARLGAWGVGGILADDMGLGKTLQALALLSFRASEGPALVVAPTSVVGNWAREAARFSPDLSVRVHRGSARERAVGRPGPGDVLVTSYDIAVRDAPELAEVRFGTVVLDEAQLVKNPATRRARAMRDLAADLKVALTGTPIENHVGELWSILRIVCPELLGSWESFCARFAYPIERDGNTRRQAQLAELLSPFILRRTKREVAPELPPRTEAVREIELSAEERALYDRERTAAIAASLGTGGDARFALLAALTRLRQLACDARLVHEGWAGPATKLDELAQLVLELKDEGHRVLVFSQFRRLLGLARDVLGAQGVTCLELTGETPAVERERRVERFQEGAADVFLISLKAGGTGLNLTAATYVIHLDPWWNPAAEDQATDRAHRIGQTEPVTVYRLVSTGTIEEAVLSLHGEKRALADSILAGKDAAATFDTEALASLLRHGFPS